MGCRNTINQETRLKRTVVFLIAANGVSLFSGLLRELFVAYILGTSAGADVLALGLFWVESVSVVVLHGFLGYALVPVVARLNAEGKETEIWRLTETLMPWLASVGLPIALVAWWYPGEIAGFLAPGFSPEQQALWAQLLPWTVTSMLVMGLGLILAAVLQARASYWGPTLGRSVFNLVFVIVLLASAAVAVSWSSARCAGIGLLLGSVFYLLLQLHSLWRMGMRWSGPRWWHPSLPDVLTTALPTLLTSLLVTVGMGGGQRYLASTLPEGSIAALSYAQRITGLVSGLSLALLTVSLTEIAREYADRNSVEAGKKAVQSSLSLALAFVVPSAALLIVLARPLCNLLLMRGSYDEHSLEMTLQCVHWFAVALIPGVIWGVLDRTGAATWQPWRSVRVAILQVATVIGGTVILLPHWGMEAIPMAFSGGMIVAAIAGYFTFRQYIGQECLKMLVLSLLKCLMAAIAAGVLVEMGAILLADSWGESTYMLDQVLVLVASTCGFSLIYLASSFALRNSEVRRLILKITQTRPIPNS